MARKATPDKLTNIFRGFDYTTEEKSEIARRIASERGISYKSARRSVERYTTSTGAQKREGTKKSLRQFADVQKPVVQEREERFPDRYAKYVVRRPGKRSECQEGGGTPVRISLAKAYYTRADAVRAVDILIEQDAQDLIIEAGAEYHAPGVYRQTVKIRKNKAGNLTGQYVYAPRNEEWAVYYILCINSD